MTKLYPWGQLANVFTPFKVDGKEVGRTEKYIQDVEIDRALKAICDHYDKRIEELEEKLFKHATDDHP